MSDLSPEYLWVAICGGLVGFLYAFGIGANDVANAFASSVSSKSLTLKQAVLCAAVFEFSGAIFLGASVTSTIRSKIIDVDIYADTPEVLMFGMFTSLTTATVMLAVATYFGLPVSTTHTVVGCIMGFSIAASGFESIQWDVAKQIFMSWLLSPLISGVMAFILFGLLRFFVMKRDNALDRVFMTFPIVLFVGIGIDLFYILYKATANFAIKDKLSLKIVLPVAFGTGALCGLMWIFIFGPIAKRRVAERNVGTDGSEPSPAKDVDVEATEAPDIVKDNEDEVVKDKDEPSSEEEEIKFTKEEAAALKEDTPEQAVKRSAYERFVDNTYGQDLHSQSMHENPKAAEIWDNAEEFDPDAEALFTYLQVFTACLNSFAHGANDIANAVAPISAIFSIYQTGEAASKSGVQKWILAYAGVGLVLGLLLYGYKVMKSVGYKLTYLSPSRGATAELAASFTVVTASFLEIPVSSTQCIVGAVSGIGLTSGPKNVQWFFLARVCVGWVLIFFISVVLSAGLFSFCYFSPSSPNL